MEKSTIIKLRQAESTSVTTNGTYSITMNKQLLLEEGDQVKIHSVFLDTTTESLIEIDELDGINITMEVAKYWFNYQQPAAKYTNDPVYAPGPPVIGVPQPDLKRYWACASYPNGASDFLCTSVYIKPLQHGAKYGDFVLEYTYYEVGSGKKRTGHAKVPQYHTRSAPHGSHFPINRYTIAHLDPVNPAGSVECINSNLSDYNVFPITPADFSYTGPHVGGRVANLWTEQIDFNLPQGRYTPGDVAKIITDKMSVININGPTGNDSTANRYLIDNPFLSTMAQLSHNITTSVGTPLFMMIPEVNQDFPTVQNVFDMTIATSSADDYFIGANQTALNYDPVLKKLNFDILHFAMYTNQGGGTDYEPGILWAGGADQAGQDLPIIPLGTFSGIAFTRLEPTSFWETLGFTDLILPWDQSSTPLTLTAGAVFPVEITSTDGLNTTNAFFGSDLVVPKTTANFFYPGATMVPSVTSLTTPIISDREFDKTTNDEGYLLVEIGVKLPQDMIGGHSNRGSTGSNKVQSIVGKYFTSGANFLQDSGAGSVVYQHIGAPQLLSDLDVRVIHPDGSVPDTNELGESNSVFLEVIKTIQPPQPPSSPKK